jgi:hypothetical protein
MAGVKVTDLTPLATADPTDVMYIVDTSSNTSKQIEVGNMFASGTWTPTFDTFGGAIIDVGSVSAFYQRVGNVITCSISLSIEVDFSAFNAGSFNFTLPFSTTTGGASGSLSSSNITKQFNGAVRPSSTTKGRIIMSSEDTSLIEPLASCHVLFQYEIN